MSVPETNPVTTPMATPVKSRLSEKPALATMTSRLLGRIDKILSGPGVNGRTKKPDFSVARSHSAKTTGTANSRHAHVCRRSLTRPENTATTYSSA